MSLPGSAPSPGRSGLEVALRVGVALVAVGAVATVVALMPLVVDLDPLPVAVYLASFLAPLGLGVILVALWRQARGRRDRLRDASQSR